MNQRQQKTVKVNLKEKYLKLHCSVAPVQEVDIEFRGDSVTCRAEGIFPAPTLTWSTDPPTDARLLQNETKTLKNSASTTFRVHSGCWETTP